MKIAVLPGDGIGPEIVAQAVRVLNALGPKFDLEEAPVGGAAYDVAGHPLPPATLELAKKADAILFGAVGDWKYDTLARELRPEQAILGLRKPRIACSGRSSRASVSYFQSPTAPNKIASAFLANSRVAGGNGWPATS